MFINTEGNTAESNSCVVLKARTLIQFLRDYNLD